MSGHTPGPWRSDGEVRGWDNGRNPAVRVTYYKGGGVSSPVAMCSPRVGKPQAIANARLIAAAPELLEALEPFAVNGVERARGEIHPEAFARARAAIAKAKNEGVVS